MGSCAVVRPSSALVLFPSGTAHRLALSPASYVYYPFAALSPAKSLPMQAFMLYMSGSGIQIFSMGIVWMLLTSPWQAAWNVLTSTYLTPFMFDPLYNANVIYAAFEPFKQTSPSDDPKTTDAPPKPSIGPLILPILTFIGCQVLVLALGVWKCKQMGLVPSGTGDWLQFETREEVSAVMPHRSSTY